ncbi:MAG: hypothetical protein OK442_02185 [Thaumarchaeota archaeon]|nr:hypothetical protein [Nitrososphaerota archaeon]
MEKTGAVLAILLVLIIVFASLSLVEYTMFGTARTTTTTVVSTTTTTVEVAQAQSSSSLSLSAECLLPVGAGANLTISGEGTTGVMATLAPGQTTFFPQNRCPQPISNQTFAYSTVFGQKVATNYYQLALDAISNPKFVSLENGTTFLFSQPESVSLSTTANGNGIYGNFNGSYDYSFSVLFYRYTDTFLRCGHFDVTAGIEVDFFAPYYQQYSNGVPTEGNWNLTNPSVEALSSNVIANEVDSCVIT